MNQKLHIFGFELTGNKEDQSLVAPNLSLYLELRDGS